MTGRKKSKSNASGKAPSGVTTTTTNPHVAPKATATLLSQSDRINTPTSRHSLPTRQMIHSSTTKSSAATSSTSVSSVPSSATRLHQEIASTSSLDKASKTFQRKKKPVNIKVSYVTEQIHIYPNYPILTVERLPNLDYHISALTENIGRRPRVYQHAKGVRFIPESNDEYRIILRYLGRIEHAEKIYWCSHTVPTGNSIKVNVKVRKVEVLKVTENLQRLNLIQGAEPTVLESKDLSKKEHKLSTKDSPRNSKPSTKDLSLDEVELSSKRFSLQNSKTTTRNLLPEEAKSNTKDFLPEDNKLSTSISGANERKPTELASKDSRSHTKANGLDNKKKKPRDIMQNRSFKKRYAN